MNLNLRYIICFIPAYGFHLAYFNNFRTNERTLLWNIWSRKSRILKLVGRRACSSCSSSKYTIILRVIVACRRTNIVIKSINKWLTYNPIQNHVNRFNILLLESQQIFPPGNINELLLTSCKYSRKLALQY